MFHKHTHMFVFDKTCVCLCSHCPPTCAHIHTHKRHWWNETCDHIHTHTRHWWNENLDHLYGFNIGLFLGYLFGWI